MRKPLSYMSYFKGNMKKSLSLILSISFSIVLLGSIHMFIANSITTGTAVNKQRNVYTLINGVENEINKEYLDSIKEHPEVLKIIPVERHYIDFRGVAIAADCEYYRMNRIDIIYMMNLLQIEYDISEIPDNNSNKFLLTDDITLNNDLSVGDTFLEFYTKDTLTLGKSFESDYYIGFAPKTLEYSEQHRTYLVIPREGRLDEMNDYLRKEADTNIAIHDKEYWNNFRDEVLGDVYNLFDIVTIIVLIIIGIGLGISTYVHYYQRRKEIGVLNSIGYSHRSILMRINKEIIFTSFLSFIIGIFMLIIEMVTINTLFLHDEGLPMFTLDFTLLSKIIVIPLFTSVFSLVPTWILLKKIDSISIIEGVN